MAQRPWLLAVIGASCCLTAAASLPVTEAEIPAMPAIVFDDNIGLFLPSVFLGDAGDLALTLGQMSNAARGSACIEVRYSADATGRHQWAGVCWQVPASGYDARQFRGVDLSSARKLRFFAHGEKGGEVVEFCPGGPRGHEGISGMSITLSRGWKEYEIDLSGRDLRTVVSGFTFLMAKTRNPSGCVFYLDEIRYE